MIAGYVGEPKHMLLHVVAFNNNLIANRTPDTWSFNNARRQAPHIVKVSI